VWLTIHRLCYGFFFFQVPSDRVIFEFELLNDFVVCAQIDQFDTFIQNTQHQFQILTASYKDTVLNEFFFLVFWHTQTRLFPQLHSLDWLSIQQSVVYFVTFDCFFVEEIEKLVPCDYTRLFIVDFGHYSINFRILGEIHHGAEDLFEFGYFDADLLFARLILILILPRLRKQALDSVHFRRANVEGMALRAVVADQPLELLEIIVLRLTPLEQLLFLFRQLFVLYFIHKPVLHCAVQNFLLDHSRPHYWQPLVLLRQAFTLVDHKHGHAPIGRIVSLRFSIRYLVVGSPVITPVQVVDGTVVSISDKLGKIRTGL
jgi:hypothetical protein